MSEVIALHASTIEEEDDDNFFSKLSNRSRSDNKERDPNDVDIQMKKKSRYATTAFTQFRWLVWRNFVDIFKNPFQIRLSIFLAIVSLNIFFFLLTIFLDIIISFLVFLLDYYIFVLIMIKQLYKILILYFF